MALLVVLFILALHQLPTAQSAPGKGLIDDDLVLAIGSCVTRLPLAQSSRAWRGNIRTLIAIEDEKLARELNRSLAAKHLEFYTYWPNRPNVRHMTGDTRVALMPWLAHQVWAGTYKWLLYGDDDTIFFPSGIKDELGDYDFKLPYVITDTWYYGFSSLTNRPYDAPRCLPCHKTADSLKAVMPALDDQQIPKIIPPVGCPCTPELACGLTKLLNPQEFTHRTTPLLRGTDYIVNKGIPTPEGMAYPTLCEHSTLWGGAGSLISAAAVAKVGFDNALQCMYDYPGNLTFKPKSLMSSMHCDRLVSLCFWLHGIAMTDPGYSVFIPSAKLTDNVITKRLLHFKEVADGQAEHEHWILRRVFSVHFHASQKFRTFAEPQKNKTGVEGVAEHMASLGAAYQAAYERIVQTAAAAG